LVGGVPNVSKTQQEPVNHIRQEDCESQESESRRRRYLSHCGRR
jgi:hypothetical protein